MTTAQARAKTKTVTRRQGWWFLNPGDLVQQVVKGMGLKKGEKVQKIHVIRILSTRAEEIGAITKEDIVREGFPGWGWCQFVEMYCDHHKLRSEELCNRIEFEYV